MLGGQDNPYCVGMGGDLFVGVAGTSGATTTFATLIAQLNNIRLANGKSSLGFLNPLLYANPQCFRDLKDFSRNTCLPRSGIGFSAVEGWDAASGLGSPIFSCLAAIVALN